MTVETKDRTETGHRFVQFLQLDLIDLSKIIVTALVRKFVCNRTKRT